MSFFNLVMIVLLKIYAVSKIFAKLVQKLLEIPFFQNVVCDQGKDRGTQIFSGGDIQQKERVFGLAGRSPPILFLSGTS